MRFSQYDASRATYFASGGVFIEDAGIAATGATDVAATAGGTFGGIKDATGFRSASVITFAGTRIVLRRSVSCLAISPRDCADTAPPLATFYAVGSPTMNRAAVTSVTDFMI